MIGWVVFGWLVLMAADLGYHWPSPQYDGQNRLEDCPLFDDGHCYYDGSSLDAEEPWRLLREEGDEALWQHLEDYWRELASREATQ